MSFWRKALGVSLIVIGIIALAIPFMPTSIFVFAGAEILGIEFLYEEKVAAFLERQSRWFIPIACIVAPFLAGAIGSLFTFSQIPTWYATLVQPSWTPPNWVFGPVWTTLYLLMGIAALLMWRTRKRGRSFALRVFFLQLTLNALWSVAFFGLHEPLYALVIILMLWCTIILMLILFSRESRAAAWLLVPYLLWVTYATTLNFGIVLLN